jgi:hypothetical protein
LVLATLTHEEPTVKIAHHLYPLVFIRSHVLDEYPEKQIKQVVRAVLAKYVAAAGPEPALWSVTKQENGNLIFRTHINGLLWSMEVKP